MQRQQQKVQKCRDDYRLQALLDAALGLEDANQMGQEEEGEAGSGTYDLNQQQQQGQGLVASASLSGGGTADHQTTPGAPCTVADLLNLAQDSSSHAQVS